LTIPHNACKTARVGGSPAISDILDVVLCQLESPEYVFRNARRTVVSIYSSYRPRPRHCSYEFGTPVFSVAWVYFDYKSACSFAVICRTSGSFFSANIVIIEPREEDCKCTPLLILGSSAAHRFSTSLKSPRSRKPSGNVVSNNPLWHKTESLRNPPELLAPGNLGAQCRVHIECHEHGTCFQYVTAIHLTGTPLSEIS